MSLRLLVPQPTAIVEPVALADVKARLRLTSSVDDAVILNNITAAREYAEKMMKRSLAPKAYALTLDRFPWPHEPIRLPAPPLSQVLSITYLDGTLTEQTWPANEYFVASKQEPALIVPLPGTIYPDTGMVPGAVEVDFIAGYGAPAIAAVPASGSTPATPAAAATPPLDQHICEGIMELAIHIYSHPEAITSEGLKEVPFAITSFFTANKVYVF